MEEKKVLLSVQDLVVKFKVRGRSLTAIRGISRADADRIRAYFDRDANSHSEESRTDEEKNKGETHL